MSKVEEEKVQSKIIQAENLNLISYSEQYKEAMIRLFESTEGDKVKADMSSIVSKAKQKLDEMLENASLLIANAEYDLAAKILIELIKHNPHNNNAVKMLGKCHLGMSNVQGAIQCFKAIVDRDESFASLAMLAEAYYASGEDAEALEFYMKALENPEVNNDLLFDIYKNIGNIFVRNRDFESAEEYYNKAFRIFPESDDLLVNYGTLQIQKSNWDEAITRFRAAIDINLKNAKAWIGLALAHREYGDLKLSLGNLHKALDNEPSNSIAIQLFVDWGLKDGQQSEVIARVESFLKFNPENQEYSMLLIKLLYFAKRYKNCLEAVDRYKFNGDHVGECLEIAKSAKTCIQTTSCEAAL